MNPPVLVYHKIETGFELGVNVVSPAAFRRQMEWLARERIEAVTLREALAARAVAGGASRRVALTFDDGYDGVARHAAPLLRALGFRATIFVPSAFVGRRSDWDTALLGRRFRHLDAGALRDLAAGGFEIGSHGATHRDLRTLDDAALHAETAGSREALAEAAHRDLSEIVCYCYPFGRSDARVRAAVVRAGFVAACGGGAPRAHAAPDPFAIARFGVRAVDDLRALATKVRGGSPLDRVKETVAHFAAGGTAWTKARLPFLP